MNLAKEVIKLRSFEEKEIWFKFNLETLRIPWIQGSDPIMITKENIIYDTLNFIDLCDMHKVYDLLLFLFLMFIYQEIKIYIENDKVNDAGGLFREWVFLLTKELFKPENGIFDKLFIKS